MIMLPNPCSGDDVLEFCAGTLTGTRSFRVTSSGHLRSLMHPTVWSRGENLARCFARRATPPADMDIDCTCGFYAFWDGSNDYRDEGHVNAVVEGYGIVVIGPRGFRAQKTRIVALHIPPPLPDYEGESDLVALAVAIRDLLLTWFVGRPLALNLNTKLRRHYPGVPVFDSFDAMVAAYPAAKGEGQRIDPPRKGVELPPWL